MQVFLGKWKYLCVLSLVSTYKYLPRLVKISEEIVYLPVRFEIGFEQASRLIMLIPEWLQALDLKLQPMSDK